MKCSRCAREIPDGSRFCGLCGGKQDDPKADPAAGSASAALALRGRAQTLIGGIMPSDVVAGGRRFAALSAGPASAPPRDAAPPVGAQAVTDTLSEDVPAGALAALLAARRPLTAPKTTQKTAPISATKDPALPARSPAATLVGAPLNLPRSVMPRSPEATQPDRLAVDQADNQGAARLDKAASNAPAGDAVTSPERPFLVRGDATAERLSPAPADLIDQTVPSLRAASVSLTDKTEQSLPPAAADLVAAIDGAADAVSDADASASHGAATMKRPRRVRPIVSAMPSVIVDSEFDREAQAVAADLSKPASSPAALAADTSALSPPTESEPVVPAEDAAPADAAQQSEPAQSAGPAKVADGEFRETAWFLDALDAEALSRAETDDIQVRQAQNKAGIDRADQLDESTRRQFSLRSNDSVPALKTSAPGLSDDAPEPVSRPSPLIGLLIFVVLALGVAGWFLFGR